MFPLKDTVSVPAKTFLTQSTSHILRGMLLQAIVSVLPDREQTYPFRSHWYGIRVRNFANAQAIL